MRHSILLCVFALLLGSAFAAQAGESSTPLSYSGKTVLITGSTDGLGRELARALAAEGARVIVHGRNVERGQALAAEINQAGQGSAQFYVADFGSMAATRDFARKIKRDHPKLDLLVNNAGIADPGQGERRVSADGYELQFSVNYLAGWVMVNLLRDELRRAAPSRVINVSSRSAQALDFEDLMLEKPGASKRGYGQSKLAQVMMTIELAPVFLKDGITMISLHPASLMNTTMVKSIGVPPRTTVEEGRDTVMALIKSPVLQPGNFYVDGEPASSRDAQAEDTKARKHLLKVSAKLTGVKLQP